MENISGTTRKIISIHLLVTQQCNFNCVYCYGKNPGPLENMDSLTARRSIDWLFDHSGTRKKVRVEFFGGEPLLNMPLIRETINYTRKQEKKSGKTTTFAMTTNGALLTEENVQFLKQHKVGTMISLDGPAQIHDSQRPLKTGGKSHGAVLSGIENIFRDAPEIISGCRATLKGPVNTNTAWEIKQYLWQLGFDNAFVTPATAPLSSGSGSRERDTAVRSALHMVEQDAALFIPLLRDKKTKILRRYRAGLLLLSLKRIRGKARSRYRCSAGRSSVAVGHDGQVYTCHRFAGMISFCQGSVFDPLPATPSKPKEQNKLPAPCLGCSANILCAGGCLYENMVQTGSPISPARDLCRITRKIVHCAREINACLTKEDVQFMKEMSLL